MTNRKGWMALFLMVLIFWVTGCGNNNDANATKQKEPTKKGTTKLIEPCELISRVEAGEIMGMKLKAGQYSEQKMVGGKICLYDAEDENSFAFFQISVNQKAFMTQKFLTSGQSAKTLFFPIKEAFSENRIDIQEMGDDAFIGTPGIHILKDDYYIVIAMGNINKNKEKLKIAGAKALANLETAIK